MMFLPESHRIEDLKPINLAEPTNIFEQSSSAAIPKTSPVTVRMKAGGTPFIMALPFITLIRTRPISQDGHLLLFTCLMAQRLAANAISSQKA